MKSEMKSAIMSDRMERTLLQLDTALHREVYGGAADERAPRYAMGEQREKVYAKLAHFSTCAATFEGDPSKLIEGFVTMRLRIRLADGREFKGEGITRIEAVCRFLLAAKRAGVLP